jgi:hypothetical protein
LCLRFLLRLRCRLHPFGWLFPFPVSFVPYLEFVQSWSLFALPLPCGSDSKFTCVVQASDSSSFMHVTVWSSKSCCFRASSYAWNYSLNSSSYRCFLQCLRICPYPLHRWHWMAASSGHPLRTCSASGSGNISWVLLGRWQEYLTLIFQVNHSRQFCIFMLSILFSVQDN